MKVTIISLMIEEYLDSHSTTCIARVGNDGNIVLNQCDVIDVITSPRGSARCGKEWSCRAESIFALKGINLKIVHSEAVHCYMGYFETYILPIIFSCMVGFCH